MDNRKTVLVVDDENGIRESLKMILKNSYHVLTSQSAEAALEFLQKTPLEIDVVFSDILMTQMNGIQFLEVLKKDYPFAEAILMTAYPTMDTTLAALRLGASDYIVKPFGVEEVLEATRRALERKKTVQRNIDQIKHLSSEIQKNYEGTTQALIAALNARDQYTGGHSYRVSKYMSAFAKHLNLNEDLIQKLEIISYLHDIGKIGISEKILNKPERLLSDEYEEIKLHPFIGYKILQSVEFLKDVLDVVLYHQEHFDGTGYPAGLKDYEIPLGARMLAIVDAYDAMTTDRPYRKKRSKEAAIQELRTQAGIQFDPDLVGSFIKIISEIEDSFLIEPTQPEESSL